jgi:tape measure domain-containing protein
VEEDLVIALSVLLEVDEAAARGIAARLGLGGRLAGNQFAAGFQKAATSGTAKAAGAVGKAASSGGSQKQAGVAAGQQFVDGYKTALTQIVSVTRASLKDQSAIQRQGTKGGQVDVDAQRAALERRTLEKRRREYELGNEYKTRNAVELADVKRHNASLIAADQQAGVRRTVLIRTMLNNMTRINQTALSGILSMWKSHQQRKLQDEASFNRRAEMELQSSMSRRTSIIRSATKEQVAAQQQAMTPSDKFNQASSTGVLGVATGRSYALGGLIGGAMGARTAYNILGEFQSIETAFKGIFREVDGGAPRTTQFLKDMQAFARETPFTLSQVSLAAQKMFANRLVNPEDADATEQLTEKLRRLADAASATGKNASQMDAALLGITQIQGTGFMMEELRQVTENIGLPMDEVAKSLGMSVKEMKDAMKEGSIGVKEGLDAIFDAMTRIPGAAGASARQAKTLRGAMSQLRDVGEQLVIKFLMPVGAAFAGMALAVGKVGDQLLSGKGAWKVARDGLQGIVGALTAIIAAKGAVGVIKLLGIGLSAIAAAPVTAALVALVGVLSTFDGLRAKLASLVEGTKNWFLVGYRANVVIDSFSGFVKVITTVGKFARTIKDFTTALVVGTKDWFLVGYRIGGVIDEFSNIVLFQSSLGAAARVIKDALQGIWDALGTLAKTRDFGEFRKALGNIAEDAGKALSPVKDALAKQFSKGVDAAKAAAGKALKAVVGWVGDNMDSIVAGARVASGGALILRMLGLAKGGNFLGAAQLGIGVAIAGALIGAAKTLAKDQTAEEFGKQINDFLQKGIDRAFDAAVIIAAVVGKLGSLVGDVWGALFGGKKEGDAAADPKASLSIAAKIAATITAAWKKATENLGNLASAIGTWFTESFTGWIVDFPYEVGRKLSSTIFQDEVFKALGTAAIAAGAAGVFIAGQFVLGFLQGMVEAAPELGGMLKDAFTGALGGEIGTAFAGSILLGMGVVFAGGKLASLAAKVAAPFRKFSIGFNSDSTRDARIGIAGLKREMDGTGSKAGDLGMKVARISDAAGRATSGLANLTERSGRKLQELGAQASGVSGKFQSAGGAIIQAGKSTNAATFVGFGGAGSNMEKFREVVGRAMVAVGGRLEKLPEQIRTVAAKVRKGWDAIGGAAGAAQAAVGVAVTGITAYYSSMSEDTATQVTGYLATVGQIAAAWVIGGPILGVVAAGAALVGTYFGNAAKQAKKEAAFLKEFEDAAKRAGDTYADALGEFGTSDQGKMAASWKVINTAIEDTDGKLQGISETFGITFEEVAKAIAGGGGEVKELRDGYVDAVADMIERTGDLTLPQFDTSRIEATKAALGELPNSWVDAKNGGIKFAESLFYVNRAFELGTIGVDEWKESLVAAGVPAEDLERITKSFRDTLEGGIGGTGGFDAYFASLADDIDAAIAKNQILVQIQEQFRQAQERLLPPVDRFIAAWDRVKEKIDKASTAASKYLDQVLGRGSTVDQAIISVTQRAIEGTAGKQEGEQESLVQPRLRENWRGALADTTDVIGTFATEANGDMGKLTASVNKFFDDLIAGATSPEQKKFFEDLRNAPEIAGAMQTALAAAPQVKTMQEFTDSWGEFVADVNNKPVLVDIQEAPDYESRKNAVSAAIVEMANANPQIKTFIEEGPGYQEVLDSILADKGLLGVGVSIPVSFTPSARMKEWLDKPFLERFGFGSAGEDPTIPVQPTIPDSAAADLQARLDGMFAASPLKVEVEAVMKPVQSLASKAIAVVADLYGKKGVKENYNGGLETSPVLSTLAERGAEAIFPLTNPARMRQIMGIPQVARAFDAAGFGAPITGNAAGTNYAPVSVDQSQVNHFEIHESSPRMTADEIFRRQRKARFHGGHTLPVVIR